MPVGFRPVNDAAETGGFDPMTGSRTAPVALPSLRNYITKTPREYGLSTASPLKKTIGEAAKGFAGGITGVNVFALPQWAFPVDYALRRSLYKALPARRPLTA